MNAEFDLIVVGGGASGFYGAIQVAEKNSNLRILILEKSSKLLSKVKVSGGGRCNVTHNCFESGTLARHYPRGEKALKLIFKRYQPKQVWDWFLARGVHLKAEGDGRIFPTTDDSQTIIDCFLHETDNFKIRIDKGKEVVEVKKNGEIFKVTCSDCSETTASKLLIAIGGHPNLSAYHWLAQMGHAIIKPIPSLFTFKDSEKEFTDLMGISVPNAEVKIAGSKFVQEGPVLITHWGLSGPAVIKLSAWAAAYLYEKKYDFTVLVSWIGSVQEDEFRNAVRDLRIQRAKQKIVSNPLFNVPQRLWQRLCELSNIEEEKIWAEMPQKNLNKLVELIIRCPFRINGKTTFKEEFVTCGGVDLNEIDLETMQSKIVKNLFFAGEVLNIDGETGGFNFQAAWSTAYIAAQCIASG